MRRSTGSLLIGAVVFGVTLVGACGRSGDPGRRLDHALLVRERDALRRQLATVEEGHVADARVAVPATLVEELLRFDLPYERAVDRFIVRVTDAGVDFSGTLAVVTLGGQLRWADRDDVEADVELVGTFEVLGIEESSGLLRARIDVLGVRTRDVRVGEMSPPAEKLVDALARRPLEDLEALYQEVRLPVRLLRSVELPAVEEDEVTIPAASVPLAVALHDVLVGDGIVLVELDVEIPGTQVHDSVAGGAVR